MRHQVKRAFTLVEILIVVVILGILAAIVVPQFTNASTEAQAGNVATQLQTLRSQIELYRVRNNGNPPALAGEDDAAWDELVAGDYVRAAPMNPRTRSTSVVIVEFTGVGADGAMPDPVEGAGWLYNDTTGEIWANYFDETAYNSGSGDPVWLDGE